MSIEGFSCGLPVDWAQMSWFWRGESAIPDFVRRSYWLSKGIHPCDWLGRAVLSDQLRNRVNLEAMAIFRRESGSSETLPPCGFVRSKFVGLPPGRMLPEHERPPGRDLERVKALRAWCGDLGKAVVLHDTTVASPRFARLRVAP
jgi:hypothetical protein